MNGVCSAGTEHFKAFWMTREEVEYCGLARKVADLLVLREKNYPGKRPQAVCVCEVYK